MKIKIKTIILLAVFLIMTTGITPTVKIPINIGRVQSDMKFSKEIFGFIVVGVIVRLKQKEFLRK